MIKFNDLNQAFLPYQEELKKIACDVIDSGWYVLGPNVKNFESEFARYIGAQFCYGVGNGTDALEIALRAVGVGTGDEVLTVANAGGYTTTALNSIGAIPVYYDVNENLIGDSNSMAKGLTKKTKAIVITHLYGQAVGVESFKKLAPGIAIVEDCAEAHGAKINGKTVGSLGDISAFSFYPTKNLGALGDGGAVLTSDPQISEKISLLRQYGWSSKYNSSIPYGRNTRLDEMQAAFLLFMLQNIETTNKQRVEIINQYKQAAPEMFSHLFNDEGYVGHLAIAQTEKRDEFRKFAESKGVATDIHFPILDNEQVSMQHIEHRTLNLDNSQIAITKIVSLPCYPNMPQEDIQLVVDCLFEFNESMI